MTQEGIDKKNIVMISSEEEIVTVTLCCIDMESQHTIANVYNSPVTIHRHGNLVHVLYVICGPLTAYTQDRLSTVQTL